MLGQNSCVEVGEGFFNPEQAVITLKLSLAPTELQ